MASRIMTTPGDVRALKQPSVTFQETPNPDAIKCIVDAPIPPLPGRSGPRSYGPGSDASADPLAVSLLGIEGVVQVLVLEGWVAVNRRPGADWRSIKRGVESALRRHVGGGEASGGSC